MLFGWGELLIVRDTIASWFDSFGAPAKGVGDDVKRVSSLFKAPELAYLEGLKSKIKSAYSLNRLRVVLLRHVALRVDGRC